MEAIRILTIDEIHPIAWDRPILYNSSMQVKCPICGVRVVWEGNPCRPFCSKRCRWIDLGAWASEKYRIELKDETDKSSPSDSTDAAVRNG